MLRLVVLKQESQSPWQRRTVTSSSIATGCVLSPWVRGTKIRDEDRFATRGVSLVPAHFLLRLRLFLLRGKGREPAECARTLQVRTGPGER